MEAAFTPASPANGDTVPYINARVEDSQVVVRVRSQGGQTSSEIRMSRDDFAQWLADATRLLQ